MAEYNMTGSCSGVRTKESGSELETKRWGGGGCLNEEAERLITPFLV